VAARGIARGCRTHWIAQMANRYVETGGSFVCLRVVYDCGEQAIVQFNESIVSIILCRLFYGSNEGRVWGDAVTPRDCLPICSDH